MIVFFEKYAFGVNPHNDDLMVISVTCKELEIKRVLVDQGSFTEILYWDALEILRLDLEDLKSFKGSLVGF